MKEIHSSQLEYHPSVHYLGRAAVHLIFQPSDRLEDALTEFIKPEEEERRKYSALLRSDEVKRLHYTGGDSTGLHYLAMSMSLGVPSDRDWLSHYKRSINQIKSQSIPVAAYRPRLERTQTGALIVEPALLPNDETKQKIGSSVLRTLHINRDDHTPDEVIYARTLIPRSLLVDDDAINAAQASLMAHLGVDESYDDNGARAPLHESPKVERMFVKTAYISDKPI